MFIDYEHVIKRCENACWHHSQLVSNLLQMIALQSRQQMATDLCVVQVNYEKKDSGISRISLSAEMHNQKIHLPMSYTALAQYLCVDRSAMTRELKNLEEEGVLKKEGRRISLMERENF